MSDKILGDVGKFLKLSHGSDVVGTKKGEIFMCTGHSVHRTGDITKDRLDAVVFKDKSVLDKAIAALKAADPATHTFLDVMTAHGRLKFGGFTMAKLARVCGSDAKAKNLFIAGATRVDPTLLGVYAAATAAMPLVGTTFQGAVPAIEPGGSIAMITANWLVSAGSAAGKYKLTTTISGKQVASELDTTAVQSMVAAAAPAAAALPPPAAPAPTITDTAVDGSDYPLTHAFIDNFDACLGGSISARMLIRLADGAGVMLAPVGRDSQATPAALRRVVRPALERFEYLLESAVAAGAVIAECISVETGVADLKSLEEAACMLTGVAPPHGPGTLGAGIGINTQAGGARRVTMSAASMLHSSGLSKSTNVRYDALCALAKDSIEVETFSSDVLAWIYR